MRKGLAVSLVLVTALAFVGCGKKAQERAAEKMIEKQSGGKVKADLSKGQFTIKDKEGRATFSQGGGAEVPEGFPKDVLVYKGSQIVMSSKQKKNFTLMLTTKADPKTVADAYKAAMKSQGWDESNMVNIEGTISIQYQKEKEKRTTAVSISKSGDQTQITLIAETGGE